MQVKARKLPLAEGEASLLSVQGKEDRSEVAGQAESAAD